MNILLTNDDGIESEGLFAAKRALDDVGRVAVIAPDSNRSAVGRGITIGRALEVTEVALPDGSTGYATDGTPVDCVRFAALGLVGDPPDVIVSGINYGLNLGDDITYSGTVAAAFEGIVLGVPAVAVSQENASRAHETGARAGYDFADGARFVAELVREIAERGLPERTILNVNVPHAPRGAVACRLGRRIYRDRLDIEELAGGRRHYRIYGAAPSHHHEDGTDFAAIGEGRIAVTPIHLDLTSMDALPALERWPLLGGG